MGQKVNPHGLRVGIIKEWSSQWYASKKDFASNLVEDEKIRTYIKETYKDKAISKVTIARIKSSASDVVKVNIYTAKPGMLIGKEAAGIETIKKGVKKIAPDKNVIVNVLEIKKPDIDAQLVAEKIAADLERRVSYRRAMKRVLSTTMKAGARGVKAMVSGRLDGAEIAKTESYHDGSIPLQTLRADIDYGFAEALTTFGILGVKVWIYKGEILNANLNREGGKV